MIDQGQAAGSDARVPTEIRIGTPADREQIYRLRHAVFAQELGQHPQNDAGRLVDALDAGDNSYLVAYRGSELLGFICLTRPGSPSLSIEKYIGRDVLPFPLDDAVLEVRLLTVPVEYRRTGAAALLMMGSFRVAQAMGAQRVVAMGRREVLAMYRMAGLTPLGIPIRSGQVDYELMTATVDELAERARNLPGLARLTEAARWTIEDPFRAPDPVVKAPAEPQGVVPCFHGGAFFEELGEDFSRLDRRGEIVNADVLDAWFPPAPAVTDALAEHLSWLASTSPPTQSAGMVAAIAAARGIPENAVLPGAGSSALIFLAFGRWLTPTSRVLLLDPCYGEYAHVLEQVVGCPVDRFLVHRADDYTYRAEELARRAAGYDLVVLVNPNSPTGRHIPGAELLAAIVDINPATRVWIDETYVDFVDPAGAAGPGESLEQYAAASTSVVVVKSMSKAYALSGLRVAYLCGPAALMNELRRWTPPWAVSLPGQLAAVRALAATDYYRGRWQQTVVLRDALHERLSALGLEVVPGVANFLLTHLPDDGPTAAEVVARCRQEGVFLRDVGSMGSTLGSSALRVAVKDEAGSDRIVGAVARALGVQARR